MSSKHCLGDETVATLLGDNPSALARLHALSHIQECDTCRALVVDALRGASIDPASQQITWTPRSLRAGEPHDLAIELAPGSKIGRYTIIERVGAGGMGVVYGAYDPELDRRVALKVLRAGNGGASADGRQRLLHEAQVMARLSHPNVLPVFDVGSLDGHLFFTMEFVEGRTLRTWLDEAPRSVNEVVATLIQAGKGLSAAHAQGIVHRDFKPDNVMVDNQGVVKVGDFGLALSGVLEGERSTPRARALVGTPVYMAPEQLKGEAVDARSDVFSFCVVAYEALFGVRPFQATSIDGLSAAISSQDLARPSKERALAGVSSRLRRIVVLGLAEKPEERYPTIQAIVTALAEAPRRRRILSAAAAAVVVCGALVPVSVHFATRDSRMCRADVGRLDSVWGSGPRTAAQASFLSIPGQDVPTAWATTSKLIDVYSAEWTRRSTEACLASARPSPTSGDATLARDCLNDRLAELSGLTALFAHADRGVIERSVQASSALTPLATCSDPKTIRNRPERPSDPTVRQRTDALRAELDALHWKTVVGKFDDVIARAEPLAAAAGKDGDRAVEAEAFFELGYARQRKSDLAGAESAFREGLRLAEAAWDKEASAKCALGLASVSNPLGHYAAAHEWGDLALGMLDALGQREDLRAGRDNDLAITNVYEGHFDEADALARRSDEELVRTYGPDNVRRTSPLLTMSMVREHQGRYRESLELSEKALTVWQNAVGPDSPRLVVSLNNVGGMHLLLGDVSHAEPLLRQGLSIAERIGATSEDVGLLSNSLGWLLWRKGQFEDALLAANRSIAVREAVGGATHPFVASSLGHRVSIERDLGQKDAALADARRALAITYKALGEQHPNTISMHVVLGEALLASGDAKAAMAEMAPSVAALRKQSDMGDVFEAELELAQATIASGDTSEGDKLLTDAEGILRGLTIDPRWADECSLVRASLEWAEGHDQEARSRARALVPLGERVGRRAQGWLDTHSARLSSR